MEGEVRGRGGKLHWTIVSIVMWSLALLFLMPFVWMVVSSLKREIDVFRLPIRWIPDPLSWNNYVEIWTGRYPITRFIGNSLIVAAARVAGELLTASLAAYAFSRLRFRGRNTIFLLYISTLIIPYQMLLVPRFILYRQLGIYDTLWALILPGIFTVFGTFLLRQFFITIPQELTDAARSDGANELQIYWQIILPLAKPAMASLAILRNAARDADLGVEVHDPARPDAVFRRERRVQRGVDLRRGRLVRHPDLHRVLRAPAAVHRRAGPIGTEGLVEPWGG
jgi:multiple sugar transport system permease protein